MEEIADLSVKGNEVEATFGRGSATEVREIKFGSKDEALDCHRQIETLQNVMAERASQRLEAFRKQQEAEEAKGGDDAVDGNKSRDISIGDKSQKIQLLVEVVSCFNLPIADLNSTDPYLTVFFGTKEVHRTKAISNT